MTKYEFEIVWYKHVNYKGDFFKLIWEELTEWKAEQLIKQENLQREEKETIKRQIISAN